MDLIIQNDRRSNVKLGPFIRGNKQNANLNILGTSLFLLENILTSHSVKNVKIPIYRQRDSEITNAEIIELLQEIILEATGNNIVIEFYEAPQRQLNELEPIQKPQTVCLFSCGIDSFSGILNSQKKFGNVIACMTRHKDYKTIGKMLNWHKTRLKSKQIGFSEFIAPSHKREVRYLRGILYLMNGLSLGHSEIIVSECGTTMFQPKFAPFDTVTKTTNPRLLMLARSIAEKTIGKKIKIIEPNANLTKAEIIACCPEKDKIEQTHSCWTVRWCSDKKTHEGNCYGCITRQIGEIVAGVNDSTYRGSPFGRDKNNGAQLCEILQLTRFSYQFLKDYRHLPNYVIDGIIKYKKVDLFERTAKDTFAALYLLNEKNKLKEPLLVKWLNKGLAIISKESLNERVSKVREGRYAPDFENILASG